jgi:hypothetical protein
MPYTQHRFYDVAHIPALKCRNTVVGKCLACGKRTRVAKTAWDRTGRPLCQFCGGNLEPSTKGYIRLYAPEVENGYRQYQPGTCERCGKKLARANPNRVCFACLGG